MSRYQKYWRIPLSLLMAFQFSIPAPAHALVVPVKIAPARTFLYVTAPARALYSVRMLDVRVIARDHIAAVYGWSERQFGCLDQLWTQESHWNFRALNRSTGAFGIPQALPGDKMRMAGPDWRTNPATQIKWGTRYVAIRYGTPCNALGFKYRNGYY